MLSDSMYLENIHEYVEDLNNIVTYKWLSRKLGVPVNAAKQMLYAYLEQNPSMEATYTVSGSLMVEDNKEFQVCIVKQDELESMKKRFKDILGVHVFSVQQSQIKDPDSLYRANYDTCAEHSDRYSRWSTIESVSDQRSRPTAPCPVSAATRPEAPELSTATPASAAAHSSQNKRTNGIGTRASSDAKKVGRADKASSKIKTKKKNPFFTLVKESGRKTAPTVREEGDDGDAAESPAREEDVAQTTMSPVKQVSAATAVSAPASAILKSTSIPHDQPPNSAPPAPVLERRLTTSAHKTLEFLGDADINGGDSDEEEPMATTTATKTERGLKGRSRNQRTKAGRKKEVSKSASKTKASKKRKRVQELSSDEDVVFLGEDKKPCNGEGKKRRKRIKKLVSKIHINEDGEMVTEKKWESDSTDASEEESAPAASTVTASPSSPMQLQKPKQSSLFRFMKKQ